MLHAMSVAQNILIIAPDTIFGLVEALPALSAIQKRHRTDSLWLVAEDEHAAVVDEVISCERRVPARDLRWSLAGLKLVAELLRTKFSQVYEFNSSARLHWFAVVPAGGEHIYSVRGRRHPGFRALRLQDQLSELLGSAGLGDLGQPSLPRREGSGGAAALTIVFPEISEDVFSNNDWVGIGKFLENMARRGLEPQLLVSGDEMAALPKSFAAIGQVRASRLTDSAEIFQNSRLVLTTDQGAAALAAAYGVATLMLVPNGINRLREVPRGDHVAVAEYGYPFEIKSENLVAATLRLFS